jgi:hypothetical protein
LKLIEIIEITVEIKCEGENKIGSLSELGLFCSELKIPEEFLPLHY